MADRFLPNRVLESQPTEESTVVLTLDHTSPSTSPSSERASSQDGDPPVNKEAEEERYSRTDSSFTQEGRYCVCMSFSSVCVMCIATGVL